MSQPSKILSRKQRRRQSPIEVEDAITPTPVLQPPPEMASIRILVCSVGNPGPYANTFHSAGHIVLSAVANSLSYPSFSKSRPHGNGLISAGSEFTLWQSTSYMNVSGTGVAAAWRVFEREAGEAKLVVVHDELELPLGQVKVRPGSNSAKGHNGLKSINGLIRGEYTRVGVGIGRPASREPDVVAAYVLKKMNGMEKSKIEGCAGKVVDELRRIAG